MTNSTQKINEAGLKIIKDFEGFSGKKYICPAGKPTIGYGHVILPGEVLPDTITKEQAEALLLADVAKIENAIRKHIKVPISDNQWSAIVSFAYNVGPANFIGSTMLKLINSKKFADAALEFLKWTKAGGKVLPGLVRRREQEKLLFQK